MNDNKQNGLVRLRILSEKYNLDFDSVFIGNNRKNKSFMQCTVADQIQIDNV